MDRSVDSEDTDDFDSILNDSFINVLSGTDPDLSSANQTTTLHSNSRRLIRKLPDSPSKPIPSIPVNPAAKSDKTYRPRTIKPQKEHIDVPEFTMTLANLLRSSRDRSTHVLYGEMSTNLINQEDSSMENSYNFQEEKVSTSLSTEKNEDEKIEIHKHLSVESRNSDACSNSLNSKFNFSDMLEGKIIDLSPNDEPQHSKAPSVHAENISHPKSDFASNLPQAFDIVRDQVILGVNSLRKISDFLSRFSQLESSYAQSLSKLVSSEFHKFTHEKEKDAMRKTDAGVYSLLSSIEGLSQSHNFLAQNLKVDLVDAFNRATESSSERINEIIDQEKNITDTMKLVRSNVEKSKLKAKKALENMGDLDQGVEISKNLSIVRSSAIQAISKGLRGSQQKLISKAHQAAESYQEEVNNANQFLHAYATRDIPQLLSDMQALEETRIQQIKTNLLHYARLMHNLSDSIFKIADETRNIVSKIDMHEDLENFIYLCSLKNNMPPSELSTFEYELDIPLSKIRAACNAKRKNGPLFGATIKELMASNPSLPAPQIFISLMKALESTDAFNTEGIFRISPSQDDLDNLCRDLESGDYSVMMESSPHLLAVLLKKWLRNLKEPLFPFSLYNSCLSMAQSVYSSDPKHLNLLVEKLDPPNQYMLKELVRICRIIQSNRPVTKMNLNSLSIVLGPNILRANTADPARMLKNARHEVAFIESILTNIKIEEDLISSNDLRNDKLKNKIHHGVLNENNGLVRSHKGSSRVIPPSSGGEIRRHRLLTRISRTQSSTELTPRLSQVSDSRSHISIVDSVGSSSDEFHGRKKLMQDAFESTAEFVLPLPAFWEQHFDEEGTAYYFNTRTGDTQWAFPIGE